MATLMFLEICERVRFYWVTIVTFQQMAYDLRKGKLFRMTLRKIDVFVTFSVVIS